MRVRESPRREEAGIVTGQRVSEGLVEQARALRRRMTPAERALWGVLRAHRLDDLHFRRQQIVGGFIVDFYCDAARLVVEVDGPIHQDRLDYDRERDRLLAARGLRVVRVTNDDVLHHLPTVLAHIMPSPPPQHEEEPGKIGRGRGRICGPSSPPRAGEGS